MTKATIIWRGEEEENVEVLAIATNGWVVRLANGEVIELDDAEFFPVRILEGVPSAKSQDA